MRVGVTLLPEYDWVEDRHRWVRAEEYGFDHAWTFDHLAWKSLADSPWFSTIPTLTAAALATTTLRLGTWVTSPNFRHPVPLAKELMTLDVISGGRLNIGLGAGAPGFDASMLGQPELSPRQASHRFQEFVTLLDLLLSQRQTNWQGDWYTAVGARTVPGCVQQPHPPFLIAANGPRTMRVAIERGAGWITMGTAQGGAGPDQWWAGVQRAVDAFEKVTDTSPNQSPTSTRFLDMETHASAFRSIDQFRDAFGRAADLGFTDVVIAWPRDSQPFAGDEKILENLASQLDSIRED
jgi:alkanesulfonate monooxygenase SsuD/methylene tetrahydromethanopterin reductase-like flavin-dependent oxidoreductase (luciferase family)